MLLSQTRLVRPACQARLVAARPSVARPTFRTISRASSGGSGADPDELSAKTQEFVNETVGTIKKKWEKTEDKPGAVLVISGTVIALSLAFSLVNAIDKIPVVSDLVELVGIGVTGWVVYRYLTVGPDRDELFISIKEFLGKVYKF
ncbi:MAG: CAAD domains of cyanobacterial aminoacyl-tRNA synthetase-domain-containing protein [Monoraphidium minutum]|nr:MAG: CAAD domains of cyanobacterial aminoacyl-tRNA synthetase-domain-containing protein [Monoraphidium minutum]